MLPYERRPYSLCFRLDTEMIVATLNRALYIALRYVMDYCTNLHV
jgi:hypothetical protein